MSKVFTCRFVFNKDFEYKDLAPVFPDILRYVLERNEHFQNAEEEEMREMYVELNMQDILANRKPEGYDRKAKYRLIFPIDAKEFNIKQFGVKQNEIKSVGEKIGDFLSAANIPFEMKMDYTVGCIPGSEEAFTLVDHNTEVPFGTTYEFGKVLRAVFKIKKPKKNAKFGYMINGVFREITVTGNSVSMNFEIVDDIYFGYN